MGTNIFLLYFNTADYATRRVSGLQNPVSAVHKGFTRNTFVGPGPTCVGNRKQAT